MLVYILRRLLWSLLTVLGVMVLLFVLFRVIAGDIATVWVGQRAPEQIKAQWRHRHGYDLPMYVNLHRRLVLTDTSGGKGAFSVADPAGSNAVNALALIVPTKEEDESLEESPQEADEPARPIVIGRWTCLMDRDTPLAELTDAQPMAAAGKDELTALTFLLSDGTKLDVSLAGVATAGELIDRINQDPANSGRIEASISSWSLAQLLNSQFFHHLANSVTFQSRSFKDNRKLTRIIAEHAPYSLAITVPAMAIGWVLAMVISSVVAYYRGSVVDQAGVLLSVLGMCVPYLAWMMYGQQLMFKISPRHAYGIFYRANVYVPVAIMVIAGLGGSVRFYRTIILNETHQDYVRTARAKGVPLPGILFKHVLKNCMLPILTNLILAIPFLIMGSLLMESYFGIPGLGDLMLTSINERNEPILNGLVFLTAMVYTIGVLVTDLSYAVFDPRVRLQ